MNVPMRIDGYGAECDDFFRPVRLVLLEAVHGPNMMSVFARNSPYAEGEPNAFHYAEEYRLEVMAQVLEGETRQFHAGVRQSDLAPRNIMLADGPRVHGGSMSRGSAPRAVLVDYDRAIVFQKTTRGVTALHEKPLPQNPVERFRRDDFSEFSGWVPESWHQGEDRGKYTRLAWLFDLQTSRFNMVFGRDKTKQANVSKTVQYPIKSQAPASRPPDVYQLGAAPCGGIDPYQQRAVAHPSRAAPYCPNAYSHEAPGSPQYLQRSSPTRALEPRNYQMASQPYSASGATSSGGRQPPLPMPPSQYSVPLPYRPPPQRTPQYRPHQASQEAQRPRPKIRMFSQKTYEQEARKSAWDRGLQEYIRAGRQGKRPY